MHFILIYGLIMLQIMQYVLQIIVVIYSYFEKMTKEVKLLWIIMLRKKMKRFRIFSGFFLVIFKGIWS